MLLVLAHGWARIPGELPTFVLRRFRNRSVQPCRRCPRCKLNWPGAAEEPSSCPACYGTTVPDPLECLLVRNRHLNVGNRTIGDGLHHDTDAQARDTRTPSESVTLKKVYSISRP